MNDVLKKAREVYFNLRYIERITDYSRLSQYENKMNNTVLSESEFRVKYKQDGIDGYYLEKINSLTNTSFDLKTLLEVKSYFAKYAELESKYNNEKRKNIFKNPETIVKWFEEQNNMCGYCAVTQDELNEIVVKRNGNLTLNQKTKRKNGILEIEQKTPVNETEEKKAYSDFENIILACPLCNNAKSNLIDESSWREIFVEPMRKYYEKVLGRKLKNSKV